MQDRAEIAGRFGKPVTHLVYSHSHGDHASGGAVFEAPEVIAPGGWLGLEVGWTQAERVKSLLERRGYASVRSRRDFAGIERVVEGRRPEA